MLEESAQELVGLQLDGGELAGFALAKGPQEFAVGQEFDRAIGRGGFKHVTGEIAQRILTGTGRLRSDVPWMFPDRCGHLCEQGWMLAAQSFFEESAHVSAQGLVMEQEIVGCRHPGASIQTEPAAGDEVMDVRVKDERTSPGVEDAEHAQLRTQAAGIGCQLVQGARGDVKEQVERDRQMRAEEPAQLFGNREGHQEVVGGQQQTRFLPGQPGVGVGLAALRTVAVVAGMIAVIKPRAVRALIELSAQSRGAAGQEFVEHLSVPPRHGRAEAQKILGRDSADQLMDAESLITVAGERVHQRSRMS